MKGHHAENAGFLNAKAGKRPLLLVSGAVAWRWIMSRLKQFETLFLYIEARLLQGRLTANKYILKCSIG